MATSERSASRCWWKEDLAMGGGAEGVWERGADIWRRGGG